MTVSKHKFIRNKKEQKEEIEARAGKVSEYVYIDGCVVYQISLCLQGLYTQDACMLI